jgi:hypothetical protein
VGAGATSTILEGKPGGNAENLIDFTEAHDTVLQGFTLRGTGQADGCARPEDVTLCSGNWYRAAVYADGHSVVDDEDPCNDASILLMHNIIEGNDIGMMIYFQPYAVVRNNVFVGNRVGLVANHHGGGTALITHNVFFGQAEHALVVTASYLDMTNNIIANNGVALDQEYIQRGRLRCNVLFGNQSLGNRFEPDVDGNVVIDPLFVDPNELDFRLGEGSGALFAGCTGAEDGEASEAGAFGSAAGEWHSD